MSLTPKDWPKFQHYKDRAPPWIKLHRGLLDNFDFHRLPVASKALAPLLWLLAAEYEGGAITAGYDEIAYRLRMSVDDLTAAVTPLILAGFFVSSEALAERKQSAMPETEGEEETEEEAKTDSRSVKADRPARVSSRFGEFWQAYPRRDGPNPRQPAEKRFDALVKTGVDPEFLIAEVKKFAALDDTRKQVGTRFIPQAVTWLNQQRWSDHAAVAFAASEIAPELLLEKAVQLFAKIRVWSKHAGPEPGMAGCRASVELLGKYGLGPDGAKIVAAA